jgi:hypothetical protein
MLPVLVWLPVWPPPLVVPALLAAITVWPQLPARAARAKATSKEVGREARMGEP